MSAGGPFVAYGGAVAATWRLSVGPASAQTRSRWSRTPSNYATRVVRWLGKHT